MEHLFFLKLYELIKIASVLGISLALFLFSHYSLKKLQNKQNFSYWQFYLIKVINKPIKTLIISTCIISIIEILYEQNNYEIFHTTKLITTTSILTWIILAFIKKLEKHFLKYNGFANTKDKEIKRSTIILLMKLCFVTTLVISCLILLQTVGVKMQAIIAFVSLGGVAVGIASRDLTASLFGTMMIYTNRPFSIGDRIKVHTYALKCEGIVENITWISTRLRLDSKKVVYIPNIQFLNVPVENTSHSAERKLVIICSIFHPDVKQVIEVLRICILKAKEQKVLYEDIIFEPRAEFEFTELEDHKVIAKISVYFNKHIIQEDFVNHKSFLSYELSELFKSNGMRFNAKFEDQ
jgi:MscS family membrane protein